MIFDVMFTTNHYFEQDVTDAMAQMEQRFVTFLCFTTVSCQNQRHKRCHKPQHKRCIPLSSKDSSLPWLLSDYFFFQGEKGDTGLRGLDGNAGVKVDTTVLSQFNPWPNAGMNS